MKTNLKIVSKIFFFSIVMSTAQGSVYFRPSLESIIRNKHTVFTEFPSEQLNKKLPGYDGTALDLAIELALKDEFGDYDQTVSGLISAGATQMKNEHFINRKVIEKFGPWIRGLRPNRPYTFEVEWVLPIYWGTPEEKEKAKEKLFSLPFYGLIQQKYYHALEAIAHEKPKAVNTPGERYIFKEGKTVAETPLDNALEKNDITAARILLEHGAQPSLFVHNYTGKLPLEVAVQAHNKEMVQLLLEQDAAETINLQNPFGGNTILQNAITDRRPLEIIELLLKYNPTPAAINNTGNFGITPLAEAINQNNLSLVKLLIQYGAQASLAMPSNKYGSVALFSRTILQNTDPEIIKFLISHADPAIILKDSIIPAKEFWGLPKDSNIKNAGRVILDENDKCVGYAVNALDIAKQKLKQGTINPEIVRLLDAKQLAHEQEGEI